MSQPTDIETKLREAADEMRAEDQKGWPVVCDEAADTIAALRKRGEALEDYARKATATITELVGGGSECFAGRIGEMYKADLDFCKQRIRERESRAHERFAKATTENIALRKQVSDAVGALEPFAEAGTAMILTGGKNPKMSGPRLAEHLERAREVLATLTGGKADA